MLPLSVPGCRYGSPQGRPPLRLVPSAAARRPELVFDPDAERDRLAKEEASLALAKLDRDAWLHDGRSAKCKHCGFVQVRKAGTSEPKHRGHRLMHLRDSKACAAARAAKARNRAFFVPLGAEEVKLRRELRCHGYTGPLDAAETAVISGHTGGKDFNVLTFRGKVRLYSADPECRAWAYTHDASGAAVPSKSRSVFPPQPHAPTPLSFFSRPPPTTTSVEPLAAFVEP